MAGRTKIKQEAMPSLLERYELKYLIPEDMVEPISKFVEIYCNKDYYSQTNPSGFYTVKNLYFDTPFFLFLKKRQEGAETKFNMRVRKYKEGQEYFLEIKQKRGMLVRKHRGCVCDPLWHKKLYEPEMKNTKEDLFYRTALAYNAEPKILTQYKRKAYISNVEYYARVTFDKELMFSEPDGYDFDVQSEMMRHYDFENIFNNGCSIILELKCYTDYVPLWMIDLIRTFELKKTRFSKYATGIFELLNTTGYAVSSRNSRGYLYD